jgi:hypothetical protein
MSSILSLTRNEADSDIRRVDKASYLRRFWIPELDLEPAAERKQTLKRSFRLATTPEETILLQTGQDLAAPTEVSFDFNPDDVSVREWQQALLQVEQKHVVKQRFFD